MVIITPWPKPQAWCTFLFVYSCVRVCAYNVCLPFSLQMRVTHSVMCCFMEMRPHCWSLKPCFSVLSTLDLRVLCLRLCLHTYNKWSVHGVCYFHCAKKDMYSKPSHSLQIFRVIRNTLGRKNLANKSFVDQRFLIWDFLIQLHKFCKDFMMFLFIKIFLNAFGSVV